jgi:hypothetical protein
MVFILKYITTKHDSHHRNTTWRHSNKSNQIVHIFESIVIPVMSESCLACWLHHDFVSISGSQGFRHTIIYIHEEIALKHLFRGWCDKELQL